MDNPVYKLLIVEDDLGIAQAIQTQASLWNFDVRIVENFRDVTGEVTSFSPHIILLDITLPFFNGLLRGVRQEVHPGAGCVNKVAWHAGLRYHRLCIQHKCQHLCSHRSGTAENFSSPGFCQGTLFFLIQGF